jgi:putative two-component system response regulator
MENNMPKILCVDDESANLALLEAMLLPKGNTVVAANSGMEALERLKEGGFDLVLMDVMMPGMNGYDACKKIRENPDTKDIPVIMITALSDRDSKIMALKAGANDFISKPVETADIIARTDSLLKMKAAQDALKVYMAGLEETVAQRTVELRKSLEEVAAAKIQAENAHLDTIERLSRAAEYKDDDTAEHIQRMSRYSHTIAWKLGLSSDDVETILYASPMHDIGKIGTPDGILLKTGKLDEKEWEVMKRHAEMGAHILHGSPSPLIRAGEIIAMSHHEKWDGSGYPKGLAGRDIPLWGRICAISDVFDALTSRRPYKPAFPNEKAIEIIRESRGGHFDPELVDIFLENIDEILDIQRQFPPQV